MGAKRKTAAKPDAEAAAKRIRAAAKAAAVVPTLNGGATVNANLQATLAACDAKIRDHFGAEVLLEAPSASSGTPAYNQRAAAAALGKGDPYTASCPLFWLNLGFEMQPAVPRYQSRITALQEHFFCEPYYLKDDPVVVYLNPGELPHQQQGALKACDPPEMRDALRQAVAKAIDDGLSAKQLNEWKECLMSVVFHFQVSDDGKGKLGEMFGSIVQKRENLGVKWENMKVSSLIRTYEIMDLKRQLESFKGKEKVTLNKHTLADYYKSIKFCKLSEPVKVSFVEVAQMLHASALHIDAVQKVLFAFDELPMNPIDSVYKIREVVIQADKKEANMVWVFPFLWDHWNRTDGKDSIPIRALQEEGSLGVSLVRLFLFKRSLRDFLWKTMENQFAWDSTIKTEIRRVTENITIARRELGFYDVTDQQVAYQSRGGWPASADLFLIIFEALVYGYKLDNAMLASLRNHKGVDDIFNHKDTRHFLQKVKDAYAKETGKEDDGEEDLGEAGKKSGATLDVEVTNANLSSAEILLKSNPNHESIPVVEAGIRAAERKVQGQIHMVVDASEGLGEMLASTLPCKIRAEEDSKQHVAIVLDAKTLCECGSQAKYRVPPTRPAQLTRLLHAVLSTRDDGLADGDALIAVDGGKGQEWVDRILKIVKQKGLSTTKHIVVYTHESMQARMERASKSPLELTESVSFITPGPLSFKVQKRLVTEGDTRGNVIGPIGKPLWSDTIKTWNLTSQQKREMFGPDNLPLPGGPCPVEHEKDAKAKNQELIPAFFHESPEIMAAELAHSLQCKAIIDLSPGSGHWAMYAVRQRVPYTGICMTDLHQDLLLKKLVSKTVNAMMDSNDVLYDASFAAAVLNITDKSDKKDDRPEAEQKPQPPNDPKPPAPQPQPSPPKDAEGAAGSGQDARAALLEKIKNHSA